MKRRIVLAVFLSAAACRSAPAPRPESSTALARPELVVQVGHRGEVTSVAYSPDGRLLASSSKDRTIQLWDPIAGRELRTLRGHAAAVNAIAFSPDGRWLASASDDRTARLWNVETGSEARVLARHNGEVRAVAFAPDGGLVASGGRDRMITLVDVASGKTLKTLSGHAGDVTSVAFSPQGSLLASGSEDKTVRLWEIESGRAAKILDGHSGAVFTVAFSPAGLWLASGSFDRTVKLWDMPSGRLLRTLGTSREQANRDFVIRIRPGHIDPVNSVAIAPDGQWLASGGSDSFIKIWDIAAGKEQQTLYRSMLAVQGLAISPDGRTIAAAQSNKEVTLWEVARGREVRRLSARAWEVWSVAVSRDGRRLASTANWGPGTIKLWDLTNGIVSAALQPVEKGIVWRVGFSSDGRTLLSAGPDARLWDAVTGRLLRNLGTGDDIAVSRDGKWMAKAGLNKTAEIWEAGVWRRTHVLPHEQMVTTVAFSPGGDLVATSGFDDVVRLWDRSTGTIQRRLIGRALTFSPDGRMLASGGADKAIRLWSIASGLEQRKLTGHTSGVTALVFSPDGHRLASAGYDRSVRIWDVATGRELLVLKAHEAAVQSVAFSPDGRHLISGSDDGTLRLWDADAGALLAVAISIEGGIDWLVATPDGLFDGSPAAWDLVLWRFGQRTRDVAPVEAFFNEYFHPGLLADLLSGKRPKAARDLRRIDRRQPRLRLQLADAPSSANAPTSTRTVRVRIEVAEAAGDNGRQSGSGARDVRLFRNGSLVRLWSGDVLSQGASRATLEAAIPITAGENRLTAYAFNRDNVKSIDATLTVAGAQSLVRSGTAYVLAIGVNEYANAQYNLKYAVADATAFAEELGRQQLALGSYGQIVVVPLLDRDATRANILRALAKFAETEPPAVGKTNEPAAFVRIAQTQPEDAIFIYYAGHGTAAGSRFFLIPHDLGYGGSRTSLNDAGLKTILAHGVSDLDLEQALRPVDAGQIVLVIDACNSGQALEAEERRRGPMNSKGLAQLAYEKGMHVLTAAQSYQAAIEAAQLGHGYLTYALVEEGLRRAAADRQPADGDIAVREWLDYAALRVPDMQDARMKQGRALVHEIAFVEGEEKIADLEKRSVQRPRAFYRREPEGRAFIVARSGLARGGSAGTRSRR